MHVWVAAEESGTLTNDMAILPVPNDVCSYFRQEPFIDLEIEILKWTADGLVVPILG